MSRFGQKQVLNLWCKNNINLFYRVIPGLQVETFGKSEFFTNYMSSSVYLWSDYLAKKINIKYHHGCSPFMYAHAMLKEEEKSEDVLVYLPKSDLTTKLDVEISKKIFDHFPENAIYLCFSLDYHYWINLNPNFANKFLIVDNDVYSPFWNFNLIKILSKFREVYVPIFSSAVLYSSYCDCKIKFYECKEIFKSVDINPILESYSLTEMTKENIKMQNYMKEVFEDEDNDEKNFLIKTFLSTEKRQKPNDLLTSLYNLHEYSFTKKHTIEDYYDNYVMSNDLKKQREILKNFDFYSEDEYLQRIEDKCVKYDQSIGTKKIKDLIEKL